MVEPGRRLGEGAVAAPVAAQHRERDEHLRREGHPGAVAGVAQPRRFPHQVVGGRVEQLAGVRAHSAQPRRVATRRFRRFAGLRTRRDRRSPEGRGDRRATAPRRRRSAPRARARRRRAPPRARRACRRPRPSRPRCAPTAIAGNVNVSRGCGCSSSPAGDHPPVGLGERVRAGEQRRGVTVGPEPEVHEVERRATPQRGVVRRGRGRRCRRRAPRRSCECTVPTGVRSSHAARAMPSLESGSVDRDEPLVTEPELGRRPVGGTRGRGFVALTGRLAAGERDGRG